MASMKEALILDLAAIGDEDGHRLVCIRYGFESGI